MRATEEERFQRRQRDLIWLFAIAALVAGSIWLALNPNYPINPGLDLQGGVQVLLAADVPDDEPITAEDMGTVRQIISQRINALGVAEPLIQVEGDRRVLVELPGVADTQEAVSLIQGTALLEFVDTGAAFLPPGTCIRTSLNPEEPSACETEAGIGPPPVYRTVLTGAGLQSASPVQEPVTGEWEVAFDLKADAADIFRDYTASHIGQPLTIVLDKRVVSSPVIQAVISDRGSISGGYTLEAAQQLALQLRYGSLPIPLRIESTRQIGATLGEASVNASVRAGGLGLLVILLFMLIYYRLPGGLADIALLVYALLNFAIFKLLGVTLTLPAITGFLLSTGMAVDANILVFERMKEELRAGRPLLASIEAGFERAWTSIRDSNVATLIICLILWGFGRNFGASIVQGFAITLAIGVVISMFTAVIVTRTLVRLVLGQAASWLEQRLGLLGI